MKILTINKEQNMSIRLFGRNLITIYNHKMILFPPSNNSYLCSMCPESISQINAQNLKDCDGGETSLSLFIKYLTTQGEVTRGFIFYDKKTNDVIGYYWLFFTGANEFEYRIRSSNIALISNIYVFEKYRGNGFVRKMVNHAMQICKEMKVQRLYAAVRKNNKSAWNAYNKIGFDIVKDYIFIRFLKINIPYYKL